LTDQPTPGVKLEDAATIKMMFRRCKIGRKKKTKTPKGNKKAKETEPEAGVPTVGGNHDVALIGNGIINEANKRTTAVGAITL
jgi:hypothetical protein